MGFFAMTVFEIQVISLNFANNSGARGGNWTRDLRITSAFESNSGRDWRREASIRIAFFAMFD